MMKSMFSLNKTNKGFNLSKPINEAPCSPIFSLEEVITANSSVAIVNQILSNPFPEDHQVVPKTPQDTDSNDKSSTTSTKLKNKILTEKRYKWLNTLFKKN